MPKFSEWLNEQIQRKGIGINQLASYTGLSPSTISKARLDQRRPEPETVIRLAKYFQVDEDWLLAVAGHRSGVDPEQEWSKVQNPQLRALLTPQNINNLSSAAQRSLIAILHS